MNTQKTAVAMLTKASAQIVKARAQDKARAIDVGYDIQVMFEHLFDLGKTPVTEENMWIKARS